MTFESKLVEQYVYALKKAERDGTPGVVVDRVTGVNWRNHRYWHIRENLPKGIVREVVSKLELISYWEELDKLEESFWITVCHPDVLVEDVHNS